jgi:MFS transporter, putative metabolite:H+ symporter
VDGACAGLAGWRWMFLIGGLGAALCWVLRRGLPESPRWLAAVGRTAEADAIVRRFEAAAGADGGVPPVEPRDLPAAPATPAPARTAPVRTLFEARWRRRTIMLGLFQLLQVFGYYGFGTLAPLVLASKGYDAFGYSHVTAVIVVLGFCYTVASNLFSNAYHVYQAELYPTTLRATGAGSSYSLSRLASAAMPYVLLPLLDDSGANAVFAFIACAMAAVILDIGLFGPRTTGRALEELAVAGGRPAPAAQLPPAPDAAAQGPTTQEPTA